MYYSDVDKYRRQRMMLIALCLLFVTIILTGVLLWNMHLRKLRNDMEAHLVNVVVNIERGFFEKAMIDSEAALEIAGQLRDEESFSEILNYMELIDVVILGDSFFYSKDYNAALYAYDLALNYSNSVAGTGAGRIEEKIEVTNRYIIFYDLIREAEIKIEELDYEEALIIYEDALLIAYDVLFSEGINIAGIGIANVQTLIVEAKRSEAVDFFVLGDTYDNSGEYILAIDNFLAAAEIYREIGDRQSVTLMNERILRSTDKLFKESVIVVPPGTEESGDDESTQESEEIPDEPEEST